MNARSSLKHGTLAMLLMVSLFSILPFVGSSSLTVASTQLEPSCDDPQVTVPLEAKNTKFNVSEIQVPKNTCIKVIVENKDDVEHDFTIEPHPEDGFDGVEFDIGPRQTNSITFVTPDKDVTYEFFCEVPGHKEQGMFGDFIVGQGSPKETSSPSFEVSLLFMGLTGLTAVILASRKKKEPN